MATKQKSSKARSTNKFRSPLAMVIFALVFAGLGFSTALLTHAAGGSSITLVPNSTDGMVHYSNSVAFNWSTTYKNGGDYYYGPHIELICYQNGVWTGMGHVYRLTQNPSKGIPLTGSHQYTFAEGDLNRLDYAWYSSPSQFDQTKPESCHAALYHFSKNNKYTELAATTFTVNP